MAKQSFAANTPRGIQKTTIYGTNTGGAGDKGTMLVTTTYGPRDRIGMRIKQLEYFLDINGEISNKTAWAAAGDKLNFGLSFLSSQPTGGWQPQNPGVIDWNSFSLRLETGVGFSTVKDPVIVKDMVSINPSEGGILAHPAALFGWSYCVNALAGAAVVYCTITYEIETIKEDQFDELWQQIFTNNV